MWKVKDAFLKILRMTCEILDCQIDDIVEIEHIKMYFN